MGWPDVRGLNEANRSREQQLWIGELFREEISPSCPSIGSGEELVYRIFVHCFGEAQLGDMFFPIMSSQAMGHTPLFAQDFAGKYHSRVRH